MSTGRSGSDAGSNSAGSNRSDRGGQGGSTLVTRLPSANSKPHFNRPACQSASMAWVYGPSKSSLLRSLRCTRPRTRTPSCMPSPVGKARMPVSITTVLSDWPMISSIGTTPGRTSSGAPIHAGCAGSSRSSLSLGGGTSGKEVHRGLLASLNLQHLAQRRAEGWPRLSDRLDALALAESSTTRVG
jgi:hypothetical protein